MLRLCAGSQYSLSVEQGWKRHESEVNHSPTQIRKAKYISVIYQHLCFSMNLSVILFVHVSVCQELYLYMCFLVDVHVSLLSESLVIHLCVCVCVCVCISVWLYLWAIPDAYLTMKRIKKLQLGPMKLDSFLWGFNFRG